MKLITVIGARPQFIKAAAVSRALKDHEGITEVSVHTGQHYDDNMSQVFFDELEIPKPQYNLGVGGGRHGEQTGRMLSGIEEVLLKEKPDMLLVYGDTNSTLAGALAAVKLHIPVAHVEAGLRSFNRKMPEEINRILTDHASQLLFTPTETADNNLRMEGISASKIHRVGDVMYDCTKYYGEKAEETTSVLSDLGLESGGFSLVTIHRAENTDDPKRLKGLFQSLEELGRNHQLVLPLHPRTRKALSAQGYSFADSGIRFVDPVGYLDMMMLEKHSRVILTDSGGVQKEAFFHQVPCVTLREETEWTELVDQGWNTLAGAADLADAFENALSVDFTEAKEIYGSGDASQKIVKDLA